MPPNNYEVICKDCGGIIPLSEEQFMGHKDFFCQSCYDKSFSMPTPLLNIGEHAHVGSVVITHVGVRHFTAQCIMCDYYEKADTQVAITFVAFCHNLHKRRETVRQSGERPKVALPNMTLPNTTKVA
jgi:hypothetical protein